MKADARAIADTSEENQGTNFNLPASIPSLADYQQPKEVVEFFEQVRSDPFNKFCIGCLENQTTHCILWIGALVCETCAE